MNEPIPLYMRNRIIDIFVLIECQSFLHHQNSKSEEKYIQHDICTGYLHKQHNSSATM
jgi:hypothetical protein